MALAGTTVTSGSILTPGGDQGPTGAPGTIGVNGYDGNLVGTIIEWPSMTPPAGYFNCNGQAISRATYSQLFTLIGTTFGAGDGATTFNVPDYLGRTPLGAGAGAGLTNRVLAAKGGEENHALVIAELAAHNHTDSGHVHYCANVNHLHSCSGVDHTHAIGAGQFSHAHSISDPGHYHVSQSALANWGFADGSHAISACQHVTADATTTVATGIGIYAATLPAGGTAAADRSLAFTSGGADRSLAFNSNSAAAVITNTGSGTAHNTMQPFIVINFIIRASYGVPVGPTVPIADTTQPGLLDQLSGLSTDFVDGTNNCQDLGSAIRLAAPIWRSYNSILNPTMEVDARTVGVGTTVSGGFGLDKWSHGRAGTSAGSLKQLDLSASGGVVIAGTSYCLSSKALRYTLTTQQASLAATDFIDINHQVEGPLFRELVGGPTSVSLVVRSSVATTFGLSIRDVAGSNAVVKLCTIPNANAWTLIQLPNIPVWPAGGTFSLAPGVIGYYLTICLAAGTTYTAPSNDAWVSGGVYIGAVGQANFAANPVNSTFDIGFVQHEPGTTCGGLIDKPFNQNYQDCLRYWNKSIPYGTALGAAAGLGEIWFYSNNGTFAFGTAPFPVAMAKSPTVTIYNSVTGAIGGARAYPAGTDITGLSSNFSEKGIGYINVAAVASGQYYRFYYAADTGW